MDGTGLKKKDLKRFRDILLAKKKEILRNAQRTLNEDMTLDADDLPDEMDLASSEYLHSFTFRLRGREKVFFGYGFGSNPPDIREDRVSRVALSGEAYLRVGMAFGQ